MSTTPQSGQRPETLAITVGRPKLEQIALSIRRYLLIQLLRRVARLVMADTEMKLGQR